MFGILNIRIGSGLLLGELVKDQNVATIAAVDWDDNDEGSNGLDTFLLELFVVIDPNSGLALDGHEAWLPGLEHAGTHSDGASELTFEPHLVEHGGITMGGLLGDSGGRAARSGFTAGKLGRMNPRGLVCHGVVVVNLAIVRGGFLPRVWERRAGRGIGLGNHGLGWGMEGGGHA